MFYRKNLVRIDKVIEKKHYCRDKNGNHRRFHDEFFRQNFIRGNQKRNVADYEQKRTVIDSARRRVRRRAAAYNVLHHRHDAADSSRREIARVYEIMKPDRIEKSGEKHENRRRNRLFLFIFRHNPVILGDRIFNYFSFREKTVTAFRGRFSLQFIIIVHRNAPVFFCMIPYAAPRRNSLRFVSPRGGLSFKKKPIINYG